MLKDAVATVVYVPNVWFAIQSTDYLADHSPSPYQHYWSLGVEEQFYILWPVLLLGLYYVVRRRRRGLVIGALRAATASLIACVALTSTQQPLAFFLLPTRAWELLLGGAIGIGLSRRQLRLPPWAPRLPAGWVLP